MRKYRTLIFILALICLTSSVYAALQYEVTRIGRKGSQQGDIISVRDLNDIGEVIGIMVSSTGTNEAFYWTKYTGKKSIVEVGGDILTTDVRANNDPGDIIGSLRFSGKDTNHYKVLWEPLPRGGYTTTLIDEQLPGVDLQVVDDISDQGEITARIDASPALIYSDFTVEYLPQPPLEHCVAINNTGQMTCTGFSPFAHLFDLETGEAMDLGSIPDGIESTPFDINNGPNPNVVGIASLGIGNPSHAFLYRNGQMEDIHDLDEFNSSYAKSINDTEMALGGLANPGDFRAFIYHERFGMKLVDEDHININWSDVDILSGSEAIDLSTGEETLESLLVPVAINNRGQFVVTGQDFEYFFAPMFVRGDCSGGNGYVSQEDVEYILNYLFNGESIVFHDPCDVNDDGSIDLSDAIHLLNFLHQGGPPPAQPFPDPGVDTTP